MQSVKLELNGQTLITALKQLLKKVLSLETIDAILVPKRHLQSPMVMPTLVSDPDQLNGIDPLAPAYAINAAKVVSKLTRKMLGHQLAVMLRPCEIRAFVELVKFNQGSMEEIVIIGSDCLGAMQNSDYFKYAKDDPDESTRFFYKNIPKNVPGSSVEKFKLSEACLACEHPLSDGADVAVLLYGVDINDYLILHAQSDKGKNLLEALAYPQVDLPEKRTELVQNLISRRIEYRDKMFQKTHAATDNLGKLSAYFAACVNCYNCRVACPVCYCRECVFVTDVFEHEPFQYLNWTRRKGAVKIPTDTLLYHLTRLAHMSMACIGCGQCSNACPNDIPVMELFRTVSHLTQLAFDYSPGADIQQMPPLTEFKEREFEEVVGIGK